MKKEAVVKHVWTSKFKLRRTQANAWSVGKTSAPGTIYSITLDNPALLPA